MSKMKLYDTTITKILTLKRRVLAVDEEDLGLKIAAIDMHMPIGVYEKTDGDIDFSYIGEEEGEDEEETFIAVEYDTQYNGGDYTDCGTIIYIPTRLINEFGGSVEIAFVMHTKIDPDHIIHYDDEELTQEDIDELKGESEEEERAYEERVQRIEENMEYIVTHFTREGL